MQVNDSCGSEGCLQLIGFSNGQEVARVGSGAGSGQKTLTLPVPILTPYFTEFALVGFGPFTFDHWWIITIVS